MLGDESTSRDYTYVDDIVDGIIKSCEYTMNNENVYEILNLGNSSPVSLKEMVNTIGKAVGVETKTTFEQGIKNFVNWYKENKELYK